MPASTDIKPLNIINTSGNTKIKSNSAEKTLRDGTSFLHPRATTFITEILSVLAYKLKGTLK